MQQATRTFLAGCLSALAGCSSADTLPSGGPYGGAAGDAGVAEGSDSSVVIIATGTSSFTFSVASSSQASSSGTASTTASTATTASSMTTNSTTSSAGPPTWTQLYDAYLSDASATIGDCDGSCHHHSECSSAAACYEWIGSPSGQMNYGALSNNGGLFSWDNGYMPTNGPTSAPDAEAAFAAWIAAGSQNN